MNQIFLFDIKYLFLALEFNPNLLADNVPNGNENVAVVLFQLFLHLVGQCAEVHTKPMQ